MADPKSVSEVRDRFRLQLKALQSTGENYEKAAKLSEQRKWTQIDKNGWSGDIYDIEGLSKPFERKEPAQDFLDAIKDAGAPGTTGDLVVSQIQTDNLACQERAFRARHASPCRLAMHAAGRRYGHGHSGGVIAKGIMGYVESLLKEAKK